MGVDLYYCKECRECVHSDDFRSCLVCFETGDICDMCDDYLLLDFQNMKRSAGTAANAHGGGRRRRQTHRVSKSLHWPSDSGSALTFVEEIHLPRTARACGPRPPCDNRQTWGRTGRSHGKSPRLP